MIHLIIYLTIYSKLLKYYNLSTFLFAFNMRSLQTIYK